MAPRRLVILSVPITRLTRILLGDTVLIPLRQNCDLVIVSPFAENRTFQAELGRTGARFCQWNLAKTLPRLLRWAYAYSVLLRIQGYWRRFQNKGMAYYLAINDLVLGDDGEDRRIPLLRRVAVSVASYIGLWPHAWRLLDRLIGRSIFNFPDLRIFASQYREVTLVQSACWGVQDQMLAWMARDCGWRKVLIPYSCDQLLCNGYMMSEFDAVCVQGPFEEKCAREFHGMRAPQVIRLGSVWFRNIDRLRQQINSAARPAPASHRKVIVYAGVSKTYIPRTTEYRGLETLLSATQRGELGDAEIRYRPLGETEELRNEVLRDWGGRKDLRILFAQMACWGLHEYPLGDVDADLREYVSQLLEADLIVMAGANGLCLDAAYLGVPAIACFADPTGTLSRRHTHLRFAEDRRLIELPAIPVVHEMSDLVPTVQELLRRPQLAMSIARQLATDWDFDARDFPRELVAAVLGPASAAAQ